MDMEKAEPIGPQTYTRVPAHVLRRRDRIYHDGHEQTVRFVDDRWQPSGEETPLLVSTAIGHSYAMLRTDQVWLTRAARPRGLRRLQNWLCGRTAE